MARRGRMSKKERDDIISLLPNKTDNEIAEQFDRTPEQIGAMREQHRVNIHVKETRDKTGDIIDQLHSRHFWKEIQKQLIDEEVPYFEQQWAAMIAVWSETNAHDEAMLKDCIIFDILCNRNLRMKKDMIVEINELKKQMEQELEKPFVPPDAVDDDDFDRAKYRDTSLLTALQTRINDIRTTMETVGRDHKNLQDKKDAKYKDLKMTREARYNKIQESKSNFFELLKVLDEQESRDKYGRLNSMNKESADRIAEEWRHIHDFEDDAPDRYILDDKSLEKGYAKDKYKKKDKGNS